MVSLHECKVSGISQSSGQLTVNVGVIINSAEVSSFFYKGSAFEDETADGCAHITAFIQADFTFRRLTKLFVYIDDCILMTANAVKR